jgi:hypothetical protein
MGSTDNSDIDYSANRHVNRWKNILFSHDTSSNYTRESDRGRCQNLDCHGESHGTVKNWYNGAASTNVQVKDEN